MSIINACPEKSNKQVKCKKKKIEFKKKIAKIKCINMKKLKKHLQNHLLK